MLVQISQLYFNSTFTDQLLPSNRLLNQQLQNYFTTKSHLQQELHNFFCNGQTLILQYNTNSSQTFTTLEPCSMHHIVCQSQAKN